MGFKIPVGVVLLRRLPFTISHRRRNQAYRLSIVLLTFFCYASYHLSRKAMSVVKDTWFPKSKCQAVGSNRSSSLSMEDVRYFEADSSFSALSSGEEALQTGNAPKFGVRDSFHVTETQEESIFSNSSECPHNWKPFDSDAALGYLDVSFVLAYSLAMFLSGHIGDRISLRYVLFVGMTLSGLFTALLGLARWLSMHNFPYFLSIQALNGVAQSTGWPCVVAVMGNWFGRGNRARGLLMGTWNAHTSVGNILGSVIPAFWNTPSQWGWAFVVPGLITFTMGLIILMFLVEQPHTVGCEPPQHHIPVEAADIRPRTNCDDAYDERQHLLFYKSVQQEGVSDTYETSQADRQGRYLIPEATLLSTKLHAVTIWQAMKIPGVIQYSICLFFTKFVFYIFLFWLPVYIRNQLSEHKGIDVKNAPHYATMFDVGGIVGGILAGLFSDYGDARALTSSAMLLIAIPSLWLFKEYSANDLGHLLGLMMLVGGAANGPYTLITTVISVDLGNHKRLQGSKKAQATVAAIIDGMGSLGAAFGLFVVSQGLKYLHDQNSWDIIIYICMGSCFLAILPLLPICQVEVETLQMKKHLRTVIEPVTVQSAWLT